MPPTGPGVRTLVLLRHAKAEPDNPLGDHARTLASRGRRQATALGRQLAEAVGGIDLAVVSGAARTVETYELLNSGLPKAPEIVTTDEVYTAGPLEILDVLAEVDTAAAPSTVLVVGHEPTISTLAHFLDGDQSDHSAMVRFGVPTATAVVLEVPVAPWSSLDQGDARIVTILRPED